jgi:hypothetical protein
MQFAAFFVGVVTHFNYCDNYVQGTPSNDFDCMSFTKKENNIPQYHPPPTAMSHLKKKTRPRSPRPWTAVCHSFIHLSPMAHSPPLGVVVVPLSPLWLHSTSTFSLSHVVVLHLHGLFQSEDAALQEGINLHGAKKMKMVAEFVGTRTQASCRMSSKTHQLPENQSNNVPSSCVHVHVSVCFCDIDR